MQESGQLADLLLKIFTQLPSAFLGIYADGTVFLWSQGTEKITGVSTEKALGKNFENLLWKDNKDNKVSLLTQLFEEKNILTYEFQLQEKNLKLTLTPLCNDDGGLIGALGEINDLTQEKKFEQLKADFISMLAHELRTPAATIKGYLEVVLKEAGGLTPELKEYLKRVNVANERQIQTIESLFSAAHLEEGTLKITPQSVNLIDTINKIIEEFREQALAKNLELKLIYPRLAVPQVLADKARLEEILRNLIGNAVKFTQKGQVVLTLTGGQESKMVKVMISDTGPGISLELQQRLFEKFARGEHTLTEFTQGTGLGLYISKKLIGLMQGKIGYETRIGKGSTFYFTLPAAL